MIRLVVIGVMETRCQEIAARLREAILLTGGDSAPSVESPSLKSYDGAVFFGPGHGDGPGIARLLQAGKHVLLSAESCLSKERLQALSGLARQANARLAIVNLDRYLPSRQLIRQQLDSGKLGEPGLIRLHRWEPAGTGEGIDPQGQAVAHRFFGWSSQGLEHEGAEPQGLEVALLRDLELVLWFFDKAPNLVYAVEQGAFDPLPHAGVQIHLGFPGRGMALLDHTRCLPAGDGYCSLAVIGAAGAAYADDHQNMQLVFRGGSLAVRTGEGVMPWSVAVQEFVDAVGQDANPAKGPTGLASFPTTAWHNVLTVAEAARISLRTKQAVIPEGLE